MGCGMHKVKRDNQDTNQKLVDLNVYNIYLQQKIIKEKIVHEKMIEDRHKVLEKKISQAPILSLSKNSLYKSRLMRKAEVLLYSTVVSNQ